MVFRLLITMNRHGVSQGSDDSGLAAALPTVSRGSGKPTSIRHPAMPNATACRNNFAATNFSLTSSQVSPLRNSAG